MNRNTLSLSLEMVMVFVTAYPGGARIILVLTLTVLAGSQSFVKAQSCTGSTTINGSTENGFPQSGRLTTNGVASTCAATKPFPGVTDTNTRNAEVYNFVNNTNAVACITVTLNPGACGGLFSAAYAGYNPFDISQNYLADIGATSNTSRSYSFNVAANSEFQVVVYQLSTIQTCPAFTLTVSGFGCPPVSKMLISEFRFGIDNHQTPNANLDEYIELYNNTDAPLTVTTTDGSEGWALVAADGLTRFVVPVGTVIPARGHFLGVNSLGYSLANYGGTGAAAGDATYTGDIPLVSGAGIALFNTANPANFTLANRLDAVGFINVPFLYRENGLTTFPGSSRGTNYFQVRSMETGLPKDTEDNESDFVLVSTGDADVAGALGAPGPENLASAVQRNVQIKASDIDVASPATCANPTFACARVRDTMPDPGNLSTFGTLSLRRRFTNNTGQPVTRLRFRVVDITTLIGFTGVPQGTADLRVLTSPTISVVTVGGGSLTVQGLTREEPPDQPRGGGLNTTLSAGSVTLATPLPAGNSIDVHFLLGVQQIGVFRFLVSVEALTLPSPPSPQRVPRKTLRPLQAIDEGRTDPKFPARTF